MNCCEYQALYSRFSAMPLAKEEWDTPQFEAWQQHGLECKACADWSLAQQCLTRGIDVAAYPCVHMAYEASRLCETHEHRGDCPDIPIIYEPRFDEYSISSRAGGGDPVLINHCPFCGVPLPESRRDAYFDALDRLGLDIDDVALPGAYRSDVWWRD